jgi:hypothetical protein
VIDSLTYRLLDKGFGLRYRSSAYYNTAFSLYPSQNRYLKACINVISLERASLSPDLPDIEDLPVVRQMIFDNTLDPWLKKAGDAQ